MDSFCLTRDDYKDFLNHMLNDKTLNNENLAYYIERAKEYFDCNIVGSNYYLSIIIEQMLKTILRSKLSYLSDLQQNN